MKFRGVVLFLFISSFLSGQPLNHLPNPGFEEFIVCPDSNQFDGYVSDWFSTSRAGRGNDLIGWYYHACGPAAPGSPASSLREILKSGVIRVRPALLTVVNKHLPGFIFARLKQPLEKDSLYYFEYTSSSNRWLIDIDDNTLPDLQRDNWCISPDRGFIFTTDPPRFDTLQPLQPYSTVNKFGRIFLKEVAVRLGQCYKATGEEEYFVYGQFFGPADNIFCLVNQYDELHLQFSEVLDNFKLEKFEPELCCDIEVCENEPIDFAPSFEYYAIPAYRQIDYIWNDGVAGSQRTFTETGHYYLTIHLDCGMRRTNSIYVNLKECSNEIYVPNAFSPNGDGLNDFVRPQWEELYGLVSFEFSIFDRWGNRVFWTGSPDDSGWDGNYRGSAAALGVYIWYVSLETMRGEERKKQVMTGDFLLVR